MSLVARVPRKVGMTRSQEAERVGRLAVFSVQYREAVDEMTTRYRIPIVIEPYPEGGYGVRSPLLPELISDGETFGEAVKNAEDAARAVVELYDDLGKDVPTL
jgi:antitoxin HicB